MALVVLTTGCLGGGDAASPPSCAGEYFAVGDHEVTYTGKGGYKSEAYYVEDIVLRSREGERLVISMYEGALLAFPPDAMNGYTAFHGHKIEVVEPISDVPEGSVGPCARFVVTELPPDWEPPGADADTDHH